MIGWVRPVFGGWTSEDALSVLPKWLRDRTICVSSVQRNEIRLVEKKAIGTYHVDDSTDSVRSSEIFLASLQLLRRHQHRGLLLLLRLLQWDLYSSMNY